MSRNSYLLQTRYGALPQPRNAAAPAAAQLQLRDNVVVKHRSDTLLGDLHAAFGWKSRLASSIGGRFVLHALRREESRLALGWTMEPPTYFEVNDALANQRASLGERCLTVSQCVGAAP